MSDTVLEIKTLTRRFGAFTAVDSLTLLVNAGEVFGLLGSNGAGKTTTLLPPSSGEARVAGFSITTQAVGVRRAIGYVSSAVFVDGSLAVYENLPIYSGRLGNVAGDQLKTACDLGGPVVGVGLLCQPGCFRQVMDQDGAQQTIFPYEDPGQLPITPLRHPQQKQEWKFQRRH